MVENQKEKRIRLITTQIVYLKKSGIALKTFSNKAKGLKIVETRLFFLKQKAAGCRKYFEFIFAIFFLVYCI